MDAPHPETLLQRYRDHIETLSQGYGKAISAAGLDGVLIHSGALKIRSVFDDQYWPLRVTPHFQHWLPLAEPDAFLLVISGKKPVLFRGLEKSFWETPAPPESDHFRGSFEIKELSAPEKVGPELPKDRKLAFIGEDLARGKALGFEEGRINPAVLLRELDGLRTLKTPYEVLCLKEANRRAARGHHAVMTAFQDGDFSELELHLLFLRETAQDDAETPYKNIVALGRHAATLHHIGYSKKREPARTILLDAGATYQGYASDVTRTAVKGNGAAELAFAALVSGMERLQQEMCRRVKPGLPYQDLHNQSHQLLAPLLKDVGIARGSEEELVEKGVTRKFLPHGLGHSLGLQTHDVGCAVVKPEARNPWLRNTSTVTPGQVFTIEPGCYFIEELMGELKASPSGSFIDWQLVERLKPMGGVRIEDDLFVDQRAPENLTREALG